MAIIKLVEVYKPSKYTQTSTPEYSLREVYVNPEHVVCLRPEESAKKWLEEGLLPSKLDSRQQFTRVYMNRGQLGLDVVVVGSPESSQEKIYSTKQLLKG